MARKEQEQIEEAEDTQETEEATQPQPGVVEVEITLQLLNQKINFLIAKLDEISHLVAQKN